MGGIQEEHVASWLTLALDLKPTVVGPVATATSFQFQLTRSHGSGKRTGLPFLTWLPIQGLVATVSKGSCGFSEQREEYFSALGADHVECRGKTRAGMGVYLGNGFLRNSLDLDLGTLKLLPALWETLEKISSPCF